LFAGQLLNRYLVGCHFMPPTTPYGMVVFILMPIIRYGLSRVN
jgi:uncharacterized membrane protein YgdD (TMEM256/DUF423 family)